MILLPQTGFSGELSWKQVWFLWALALTSSMLFQETYSYAMPSEEMKEDDSPGSNFNGASTPSGVTPTPERKRRFCLNRLQGALRLVCSSGSSRAPLYFNPHQLVFNDSTNLFLFGGPQNPKNNIPVIAQRQRNRRVVRRRSRRNIVRECCDKPCNYSSLKKYCAPSVRVSEQLDADLFGEGQSVTGYNLPPSPSQCVSVADMQNFYLNFFRKPWKKDDYRHQLQAPDLTGTANTYKWDGADVTSTDSFYQTNRKQSKELQPTYTSPPSTTEAEETRDVNEIDDLSETNDEMIRPLVDQSGNIRTIPPIRSYINIPRGTNDYLY